MVTPNATQEDVTPQSFTVGEIFEYLEKEGDQEDSTDEEDEMQK